MIIIILLLYIMMKLGNPVVDVAASSQEFDRIGLDCKLGLQSNWYTI